MSVSLRVYVKEREKKKEEEYAQMLIITFFALWCLISQRFKVSLF